MKDRFGREIRYLRLSVTDLCDLRCVYCMPPEGVKKRPHGDILSVEEIDRAVHAAARCGIQKVRITGGEPLVRRGLLDICRNAAQTPGIEELCLTTNGTQLERFAQPLREAGVSRLNISLDTLNADKYRSITRLGELDSVLAGLEAARQAGFTDTKLNCVLMGGVNDDEIGDFVALTREMDYTVRFIELMPIGACAHWPTERFLPCDRVLEQVPQLQPLGGEGVAKCYQVPGWRGKVGLIRPLSQHFCPDCNRLRLTADGKVKPCLHSAQELSLKGLTEEEMERTLREAILAKPQRHHLGPGYASESRRCMSEIGG